jgi:hypothetical protein
MAAVRVYASEHGLPSPTHEIGFGLEGVVYATEDQEVAVKVSPSMRGYDLIDLQGDPGVIRIFHHAELTVHDEALLKFGYGFGGEPVTLLVIWMEHLIEANSGIFDILRIPRDIADDIMGTLEMVNGSSKASLRGGLPILSRYEAFSALNELISKHSWSDMGIRNVGLSRSGQVVLFDS